MKTRLRKLADALTRPARLPAALLLLSATLAVNAAYTIRSRVVNGVTYVHLQDVAGYYGMKMASYRSRAGKQMVNLNGVGRRLELTLNSRQARINGCTANLSYPALLHQENLLLAERDLSMLIDPLFRDWGLPDHSIKRIIIDPGHGGRDPGAIGRHLGKQEKTITLQVGLLLKKVLEAQGYKVVMTRSNDTYLTLKSRGKFKGDLFISLHCNSATAGSAIGVETWYAAPQNTYSSLSPRQFYRTAEPGNRHDRLNSRLAYEVQRYTLHYSKAVDRGIKRARYQVLCQAQCPAILVEMGFLSNRIEEGKLANPAHQRKLALGIVSGIVAFHRALASRPNARIHPRQKARSND